ncbi:MAG: glycosyltransferase [Bacteroidota bacterium]
MLDPWALSNSKWKKSIAALLFERRSLQQTDCIHALNDSEALAIRQFGLKNPIAVIPNGVHPVRAGMKPPPRPTSLKVDGRKILLFMSRIHRKKGIGELLEAFALARQRNKALADAWRLVIAGWQDGQFKEDPQQQAKRLGLGECTSFVGTVLGEDKAAMLSHTDAFVLPSHSEGLPMSVLEAWSYGVPVLMTKACNLSEAFSANAALEISMQPSDLADQLIDYLDRDLNEIGNAGREMAVNQFAWKSIASRHIQIYQYMLGHAPVTPSDLRIL